MPWHPTAIEALCVLTVRLSLFELILIIHRIKTALIAGTHRKSAIWIWVLAREYLVFSIGCIDGIT